MLSFIIWLPFLYIIRCYIVKIVFKDGGGEPLLKGRNADILVSRELVGRGPRLLGGARDLGE